MDDLLSMLNEAMKSRRNLGVKRDVKKDAGRFKMEITDVETGEVEVKTTTDIVLLVYHDIHCESTAITQLVACTIGDLLCALKGLHKLINRLTESVLEKSPGLALMVAMDGADKTPAEALLKLMEENS